MTQRKAAVFLVIFALTVRFNFIASDEGSDEESSYYYYSSYYSSYYYNYTSNSCTELSEDKCKSFEIGVCPVFVRNYCVV